ncbi:MAG: 2-hydroxyacyl-CoA dehydratase [Deltaproteobacteria bacterium]|nr:2-hydroxyacyl-CoA dehydratase [Deltaproteobacteria bacterium]
MAKDRKSKDDKHYSPPLKCWRFLKEVNNAYDDRIRAAIEGGKPIVIATAMVPQQLINAFDVVYIAGEWYGSICGFYRDVKLAETAERCGFLHELCSYARMTLGSMIEDRGFLGRFPKPTAVIGAEGLCIVQAKWFESLARYHNAPFTVIDSAPIMAHPYKNWGEGAVRESVEFVARQCANILDFLEWATGQKLDEERLVDTVRTMHRNEVLWDELLDLWGRNPSPITIRNLFTLENLIISLPCTKDATKVLEVAIEEVKERIEKGITGIENEEVRLLWNAQPGWYILGTMEYFQSQGATFVASPYLALWGSKYRYNSIGSAAPEWLKQWKEPSNVEECLLEIAKGMTAQNSARPRLDAQIEEIIRMAIRTEADGGVWHAVRGCKGVSYGGLGELEAIRNDLGLPGLVIEGSPADPRDFSEGPALRQIRVFVEQVKRMKKRRMAKQARKKGAQA